MYVRAYITLIVSLYGQSAEDICLEYLSGERLKNASLCQRFGIESKNAAQTSQVIKAALEKEWIKVADVEHPRSGYLPFWV